MEVQAYMADGLPPRHIPGFLRRNKLIEKTIVSTVVVIPAKSNLAGSKVFDIKFIMFCS